VRIRFGWAQDCRANELLAALADEATAMGAEVLPAGAPTSDAVEVFVPEPLGSAAPEALERAIAICVAYPGRPEFDFAASAGKAAGAAFDLTRAGWLEQRRRGSAAHRLRLGMSARWLVADPVPPSARPGSAILLAARSPRVEAMVAAAAPALAATRAEIRLRRPGLAAPDSWRRERRELLARASLVLDVHPFRPHGLDWVMALEAIGAGAVPLFEHATASAPLVPDAHVAFAHGSQLGIAAQALLEDPARLDRMAVDARAMVAAELPMRPAVERLLGVAERLQRSRRRGRARGWPVPRSDGRRLERRVADAPARKGAALVHIERRRARQLRELASKGLPGVAELAYATPAWEMARPDASVCVPCHDDGELATRALESAAASIGVGPELIVLDDASSDGSCERIERWLRERPHLPARLLRSPVNLGPGAARNVMLEQSRTPFAFMLDADNVLFPRGLSVLVGHMASAPPEVLLAYGPLERHRDGEPLGLLSADPWDPARFRDGNYIDAMCLLRRDAILDIGGFTEDLTLYGWEDFDLWCRVAERGRRGELVPVIVGRYAERPGSVLEIASIDASEAVAVLRGRYPSVYPGMPEPVIGIAT
jgi:hypothetical protein